MKTNVPLSRIPGIHAMRPGTLGLITVAKSSNSLSPNFIEVMGTLEITHKKERVGQWLRLSDFIEVLGTLD
jgi:hypothetical protein